MPGNAGLAFSQSGLICTCLNCLVFKFACWALIWSHPFLIVTYIAKRCKLPDKCRLRAPQGTDREGLAFWTLFLVCKKVHPKCTVSILNRHLGGKKNSSDEHKARARAERGRYRQGGRPPSHSFWIDDDSSNGSCR